MSPTQHITLRTRALLKLDPEESSDRWHALFLEAGLLTTVPESQPPGSPLALLQAARDGLLALQTLEGELLEAAAPVGGFGNHAPLWAWTAALSVPLVSWVMTNLGETSEEMLQAFGLGVYTAAAIAALGLAWVIQLELGARKRRSEAIRSLELRIAPLVTALTPSAQAVLSRSFVARAGPRLVVSTPHLAWLQACTAAAKRGTRDRARASVELVQLIADLEVAAAGVQAALQALRMEAPPRWADTGLAPDLRPYRARLAHLGITPDPLCLALDQAWGVVSR